MLEDQDLSQDERAARLAREINAAFDAPGADVSADQVFARLEQRAKADKAPKNHGSGGSSPVARTQP
jgi:hypothetical protein